ncbi:SHD1 domain-containing protein [Blastopirellula retiformator]|uniref:SLA1 homology domain-containing protein n=1 Tax=Blastopirellula retiformator TaxID=2527970 RepID=A0A5C5UTJ1_9BACT|nr:SHD1 domain-containing protein [Blastopirellula retiformator]TWT29711.1 hypothetical protein Enr8_48990 [Blastopirellula retiformator]
MSQSMKIAFLLATIIATGLTGNAQARIWVDSEGRSVDAEFVKFEGNTVHLRRNDDNSMIEVTYSKFSEADKRLLTVLREQVEAAMSSDADDAPADYAASVGKSGASAKSDISEADARRELSRTRKWTDEDGNQIQAKFVRMHDGNVILLQGNKGHNVDFYTLSDIDQEFLREQMEALGQGDDVPPVMVKTIEPNIGTNNAVAGTPPGMSNFPGQFGPQGMSRPPGFTGSRPPGFSSPPGISNPPGFSRPPGLPSPSSVASMPSMPRGSSISSSEPPRIASNTPSRVGAPSYDPWAGSSAAKNSAPPKTSHLPSMRPPSTPAPSIPETATTSPPMSVPEVNIPGPQLEMVWECKTCGTQFDTVEKPSFCHFCTSIKIGGGILLALVGAAIKGAMSS